MGYVVWWGKKYLIHFRIRSRGLNTFRMYCICRLHSPLLLSKYHKGEWGVKRHQEGSSLVCWQQALPTPSENQGNAVWQPTKLRYTGKSTTITDGQNTYELGPTPTLDWTRQPGHRETTVWAKKSKGLCQNDVLGNNLPHHNNSPGLLCHSIASHPTSGQ
jgi:hypothetical protein